MPTLHITKPGEKSRTVRLNEARILVLGRAPTCDVPLPDSDRRISRCHAALVRASGAVESYFIRDLGSIEGVRVAGELVYQRTLQDRDVIEIGKYRITYSRRDGSPSEQVSRIRVVTEKQAGAQGVTGSTVVPCASSVPYLKVTDARREVVEHILHRGARSSSLADLLAESIPLIVQAVDATRGFAGIFTADDGQTFREVGVTGFAGEEAIEIDDEQFCARLRKGEVIEKDTLLLTPVASSKNMLGFICVERPPYRTEFTQEDAEYLLMLGRLAADSQSGNHVKGVDTPQEWGTDLVANAKRLGEFQEEIVDAATQDDHVLLLGETGTGKDVFARAIAKRSPHANGPYIARNCAAIPSELVDTELFGYAPNSGINNADPKGAPGCFENADNGVLFLNELHGLKLPVQDKLLSVLDDKEVWRIAARKPVPVNVRVIAATDKDVSQELRQTLRYRFKKVITLPPLRERRDDIPLLAFYFLDRFACRLGTRTRSISHRTLELISNYEWLGNVRDLEKVLKDAVKKNPEVLVSWHLPDYLRRESTADETSRAAVDPTITKQPAAFRTVREMEKDKLLEALQATHGNITAAARLMGYKSRMTMLNKMKSFDIPRDYGDNPNQESGTASGTKSGGQ